MLLMIPTPSLSFPCVPNHSTFASVLTWRTLFSFDRLESHITSSASLSSFCAVQRIHPLSLHRCPYCFRIFPTIIVITITTIQLYC